MRTITPIPPIHWERERHHWRVLGRRSGRRAMVRPVPLKPERLSKKALVKSAYGKSRVFPSLFATR
jgi:hypothetical protein